MKRLALIPVVIMLIGFSGCQGKSPQGMPETLVADMPPGQTLFLNHCVSCHMGAGNPPGPNAVILDSSRLLNEPAFRDVLRHPPSAMMRSFSEQELSDADVHLMYEYLVAAKTPQQTH